MNLVEARSALVKAQAALLGLGYSHASQVVGDALTFLDAQKGREALAHVGTTGHAPSISQEG